VIGTSALPSRITIGTMCGLRSWLRKFELTMNTASITRNTRQYSLGAWESSHRWNSDVWARCETLSIAAADMVVSDICPPVPACPLPARVPPPPPPSACSGWDTCTVGASPGLVTCRAWNSRSVLPMRIC